MMSKFSGVLAVVILVQYVIADDAPVGDGKNTITINCTPSVDLNNVKFATFQDVIDKNPKVKGISELKPYYLKWKPDPNDASLRGNFFTELDAVYKGKLDIYEPFRSLVLTTDKGLNGGTSSIPDNCTD
ncbi:uncharacterized protein LOC126840832 [Adelges cooleyi]|uniref:uncharacterized protein LOC126840832 n=1 Tax=Adelges cooleyi TaxID=133065 RepID=UPI0021803629|nr:uncharacterized protein LOC126840832 [Adelges cooleyi]